MAKRTKRKLAKKSAKSKKKPQTRTKASPTRFKYFCAGGTCKARPRIKHLRKGSTVSLLASGTSATLDFGSSGSPFKSGVNPIKLADGDERTEVVARTAGTFQYDLSCGSCAGEPSALPKMIVDP